jgi:hypothetical protein
MTNINSMQGEIPLSAKPDYEAYVNLLESRGWMREQITLDELNTNLSAVTGINLGQTGVVIQVTCPAGQKISIMGVQQIPRGADARSAHALRLRIADSTDTEINLMTKIRITKEKTSEAVVQLARVFYQDVNLAKNALIAGTYPVVNKTDLEWYRFKQGVELNGQQFMRIYVVNSPVGIAANTIRFALDMDLWTYEG